MRWIVMAALLFSTGGNLFSSANRDTGKAGEKRRSVAILIFDGVEIIDYAAPYEVFGQAKFNVFTVGPTKEPITTAMGQKLIPAYGFADAPPAEIVVLPGGDVDVDKASVVDWVRGRAKGPEVVLSVCNGALWLAKAGLLDGLTATTFHGSIADLQATAPKAHVVRDRRFVDNGLIVTSAGLTSGMDSSLHVVDRLLGRTRAREIALNLEYDWRPDSEYARANLADQYLPEIEIGDDATFKMVASLGDLDHWRVEGVLKTRETLSALRSRVAAQLGKRPLWKPLTPGGSSTAWSFSDERGRAWGANFVLAPGSDPGSFQCTFTVERSGAPAIAP